MTAKLSTLSCACALALGLSSAQATLLGEYTFDGNSPAATNVASVVSMDDWVANAGGISGARATIEGNQTPNNTTDPDNSDAYHSFSLTVQNLNAGEFLRLDSVAGDYYSENYHDGENNHSFELYGFMATSTNSFETVVITKPTTSTNFNIVTTGVGPLSNDDTVEFRFYFTDSNSHSWAYTQSLDNITLSGTVIPEPGSYALLGGCLALAWVMVRRRRA